MVISERIKELRKINNLTQKQLADAIEISWRAIQNYEILQRTPTLDIAITLANYFDVSIDYLVGLTDNPVRNN